MNLGRFTHITPVAGISALGLVIGLTVSACGAAASSTAAGTVLATTAAGATGPAGATAASTPAAASSTPAASTPAASTRAADPRAADGPATSAPAGSTAPGPVARSSAPATATSSAPAPAPGGTTATPIPIDGPFVMWDCTNKPEVRPASFVLACADGNDGLTSLHWTNWVPPGVAGTGIQYLNDCTPNCAAGRFQDFPVDISLSGSYRATANGPFAYTEITLTYTGPRPTVYVTINGKVVATHPATWSQKLPPYVAT